MVKSYFKLLRTSQWIKNTFIFVPLIFSKHLFDYNFFKIVLLGFIAFSLLTSIVYIFNDLIDIESDKLHPVKKFRPITSGKISKKNATITAIIIALILSAMLPLFNIEFDLVLLSYLILNLFYSLIFKYIVLLDIFSIATGFMLRVIAGAYIIDIYISSWLILTTMFISLFLAIMKRQSELKLLEQEQDKNSTRHVLSSYSLEFTNQMATITASGVIICYALYSVAQRTISIFKTEDLIYTTPFVVFGIFRYMYLVYIGKKGENTTEIMLSDIPMIINFFLYLIITILIIY
ncbi:MAG TPA: decaprenyl-phosphate phosphoribosyltransferase [Ignavibacteria bacterium]|nr:decaprenyl-phosphate phosphoribosyltransferase [Ignavibacteria bacterium]